MKKMLIPEKKEREAAESRGIVKEYFLIDTLALVNFTWLL